MSILHEEPGFNTEILRKQRDRLRVMPPHTTIAVSVGLTSQWRHDGK